MNKADDPIGALARALEKTLLIVQKMLKVQTDMAENILALSQRLNQLEEKCHENPTRSGG